MITDDDTDQVNLGSSALRLVLHVAVCSVLYGALCLVLNAGKMQRALSIVFCFE